jgi:hypothetical protein
MIAEGAGMDNGNLFEHRFRPLLSATVGSGVVTLAMMNFAGSAWGDLGIRARVLVADAMRASMLMFLFALLLLVTSYALERKMTARQRVAVNFAGTGIFLAGTVISGRALSTALAIASARSEPTSEILAFFGISLAVSIALLASLAWGAVRKSAPG